MSISSLNRIFRASGNELVVQPALKAWTQRYARLKQWTYAYWLALSCVPLALVALGGRLASVEFSLIELLTGVCVYAVVAEQGLSAMLESLERVKPVREDKLIAERLANMTQSWQEARKYAQNVQDSGRELAIVDFWVMSEQVRDDSTQAAQELKTRFGQTGAEQAEASYRWAKLAYYAHVGLPIFVVLIIVAGALVWAGVNPIWTVPFLALLGTWIHNSGLADDAKHRVYRAAPVWLAPELEGKLAQLEALGGQEWQSVQAVLRDGRSLLVGDVPHPAVTEPSS